MEERALVMELVPGPTLADRIAQGPIPFEEALRIAAQIAEALEYAHDHGIVHRDLAIGLPSPSVQPLPAANYAFSRASPDGRRITYELDDGEGSSIRRRRWLLSRTGSRT